MAISKELVPQEIRYYLKRYCSACGKKLILKDKYSTQLYNELVETYKIGCPNQSFFADLWSSLRGHYLHDDHELFVTAPHELIYPTGMKHRAVLEKSRY